MELDVEDAMFNVGGAGESMDWSAISGTSGDGEARSAQRLLVDIVELRRDVPGELEADVIRLRVEP